MRKLISKKVYKVERLWCYKRYYDANIIGLLYLKTRKFLWLDLKPILYIEVRFHILTSLFMMASMVQIVAYHLWRCR